MRLKADIRLQRKDVVKLHEWLDQMAPGWAYWGSAISGELDSERSKEVRRHNDEYAVGCVEDDRGHLWSTIQFVLPNENAAMLCKLTWLHAEVERPSTGLYDAHKQPIGAGLAS